jgi:hypothetical protein
MVYARKITWTAATVLNDGRVLVTGGDPRGGWDAEIFDPLANQWHTTTGSRMLPGDSGRNGHTQTLLRDGTVLVVGGNSRNLTWTQGAVTTFHGTGAAHIFNPRTNSFRRVGPLHRARFGHSASLLSDGRVLILGGVSGIDWFMPAEIYDPGTGKFTLLGRHSELARMDHEAVSLSDNRVLILGQRWLEEFAGNFGDRSVKLYENGAFRLTTPTAGINRNCAARLPSGEVLAVGFDRLAETWNPRTEAWSRLRVDMDPDQWARNFKTIVSFRGRTYVIGNGFVCKLDDQARAFKKEASLTRVDPGSYGNGVPSAGGLKAIPLEDRRRILVLRSDRTTSFLESQ